MSPTSPWDRLSQCEWSEAAAPGAGRWLWSKSDDHAYFLAAPGVPLGVAEPVARQGSWRLGRAALDERGRASAAGARGMWASARTLTVAEAVSLLPDSRRPWVRERAIARLREWEAFSRAQPGVLIGEERARAAGIEIAAQRRDLQEAFPEDDWTAPSRQPVPPIPDTGAELLSRMTRRSSLRLPAPAGTSLLRPLDSVWRTLSRRLPWRLLRRLRAGTLGSVPDLQRHPEAEALAAEPPVTAEAKSGRPAGAPEASLRVRRIAED